jgi:hypothetical protein
MKYCVYYTPDEKGFVVPGIVGNPGFIHFNNPAMNKYAKMRLFDKREAEGYIRRSHNEISTIRKYVHICSEEEVYLVWAEQKLKIST